MDASGFWRPEKQTKKILLLNFNCIALSFETVDFYFAAWTCGALEKGGDSLRGDHQNGATVLQHPPLQPDQQREHLWKCS